MKNFPEGCKLWPSWPWKLQNGAVFLLSLRPEAKLEAVIEAGRVNLPQKSPKNLKEAAAASKKLLRHSVFADSEQFWAVLKLFWIWLHLIKLKIFNG